MANAQAMIEPIPKPEKRKKNQGHKDWINFRRKFLETRKEWDYRYRCEHCQGLFHIIDIDHIQKRSLRPDLVLEPSNLRLLCRSCHNNVHKNSLQP